MPHRWPFCDPFLCVFHRKVNPMKQYRHSSTPMKHQSAPFLSFDYTAPYAGFPILSCIYPDKINVGISDTEGNLSFDGKSFLDVLLGKTEKHRDYTYGVHTTRGVINGSESYPIRSVRSNKYKYIQNLSYDEPFYNVVTAKDKARPGYILYESWLENAKNDEELNWVKHYKKRPFEELYDLENDPYEKNNLADHPEYFEVKKGLEAKLYSWMKQQGDDGIETEMNAISRQDRDGEWVSYEQKLKVKIQ